MKFFSEKQDVLQAALWYARRGYPVFPVHYNPSDEGQGSFSPLCVGGCKVATTEENQICKWWTDFPDALIAVSTGAASGILAVTTPQSSPLDTKTPCFSTFFSENCYIFQYPQSSENPAYGALNGGQFHGEGGFIVVPPSSLTYKNAENETISGCYSILQDGEMVGAPGELLEKVRAVATVEKTERETVTPKPDIMRAVEKPQEQEPEQEEEEGLPGLPLECLPEKLRTVIEGVSKVFCVDEWLPFAAALRTAATIIGANVMLEHRQQTPGHLWLCLVGAPSLGKSEITRFFNGAVYKQQKFFCDMYENALETYKNDIAIWEQAKSEALKKKEELKEKKPQLPGKTTLYVDDVTPESLIMTLKDNPGGVSWDCDEIRALLNSFGRYGGTGSGEAAKARLLSLYSGAPVKLDRKGGEVSLMIQRGWLSIFGTVQPSILPKIFDKDDRASGFLQRFMFINAKATTPTATAKRPILRDFEHAVTDIFDKLLLSVERLEPTAESEPVFVRIDRQGREMLDGFLDEITRQAYYLSGEGEEAEEAQSRAGRWQEQLPRLILLMHCLERAADGLGIGSIISAQTVEKTIYIFRALMEHSKTAWKLIKNERVKTPKTFDIIDIIDKYVDKTKEVFEIRYAERVGTKTKSDLILAEIGAGNANISTRQALTKTLENIGFSKKSYNAGIKVVIEKDKYQTLIAKIEAKKAGERQTAFVPTPAQTQDDFFKEFTDAAGAGNF